MASQIQELAEQLRWISKKSAGQIDHFERAAARARTLSARATGPHGGATRSHLDQAARAARDGAAAYESFCRNAHTFADRLATGKMLAAATAKSLVPAAATVAANKADLPDEPIMGLADEAVRLATDRGYRGLAREQLSNAVASVMKRLR